MLLGLLQLDNFPVKPHSWPSSSWPQHCHCLITVAHAWFSLTSDRPLTTDVATGIAKASAMASCKLRLVDKKNMDMVREPDANSVFGIALYFTLCWTSFQKLSALLNLPVFQDHCSHELFFFTDCKMKLLHFTMREW